jgi:hypothetical protein
MSGYRFAEAADGLALGAFLERLLALDKAAAVRLVGVGPVAAAYGAPPLHGSASRGVTVLVVRTVALAPDSPPFDRTVVAGQLLDAIGADSRDFTLPEALVGGPSWAGLLPPRTGWRPLGELTVRELSEAVAQGNADFRFGALGRDRAGLDALAEEIWTREFPLGLRWRAAHAASVMGFLGPETAGGAVARVSAHNRWLRLDAPFGTVIERTTGNESAEPTRDG